MQVLPHCASAGESIIAAERKGSLFGFSAATCLKISHQRLGKRSLVAK